MEKTTEKNEPKPFHVEMQKLSLAINMIDLAQKNHMSKEEIVETTELIQYLLNEKATAATVTNSGEDSFLKYATTLKGITDIPTVGFIELNPEPIKQISSSNLEYEIREMLGKERYDLLKEEIQNILVRNNLNKLQMQYFIQHLSQIFQ